MIHVEKNNQLTAEYERRAQLHRPNDPQTLAREIARLRASGLRPRDIAAALRLDLSTVLAIQSEDQQ